MASKSHGSSSKNGKNGKKKKGSSKSFVPMCREPENIRVPSHIQNYIYMEGCQNIQIGDGNSIIHSRREAEDLLHKSAGRESEFSKNEVLVGMVNSILNPQLMTKPQEMPLSELRRKFEILYGRSFDSFSSLKLDQFLDRNSFWFEKNSINHRVMVKPIIRMRRPQNTKQKEKQVRQQNDMVSEAETDLEYLTADASSDMDDSLKDTMKTHTNSDTDIPSVHDSESSTLEADESDSNIPWNQVKRKTKSKRRVKNDDEQVILLQSLLDNERSDHVIFKESLATYATNPCDLMLDIISQWNTPGRLRSYIVIGVHESNTENRLCGLKTSVSKAWFEKLIKAELWTNFPSYKYFEVKLGRKLFGVLEIPSSYNNGIPSISKGKCIYSHGKSCFGSNELWYIEGKLKKPLLLSDPNVAMIYQWFSGQDNNENVKIRRTASKGEFSIVRKNASTSMSFSSDDVLQNENQSSGKDQFITAVNSFKKGRHILVTGDLPRDVRSQEAISLVPWLAVFDFDINSRDGGLLNANEDFISKRRSLHITSWTSTFCGISENATLWSFPRGRRDDPQSRMLNHEEKDQRKWIKKTKYLLDKQIDQIQKFIEDYTVLTVLILWPKDEQICPFMTKFLERMDDLIDPSPKLVLCLPDEPVTEVGSSYYKVLCGDQMENLTVVRISYGEAFSSIIEVMKSQQYATKVEYKLPTADDCNNPFFDDKEATWLREEIDVLYLDNPYEKAQIDVQALSEETEDFFRGGSLHWFAWYECGAGHFDVERDIMEIVKSRVQKHLEENKCTIMNLYHAPGSGGTTLAQRILWDLHAKFPSAHIKLRSSLPAEELVARVEMVFDRTHLPVLLLIDGEDESKVKFLIKLLKARCTSVILYVKRFPYPPDKLTGTSKNMYLKGQVSKEEAKRLALKYRDRCSGDLKKIQNLESLSEGVAKGEHHSLYEFGLAAYLHEFKGLESYVKGYLEIDKVSSENMNPWQKCLGFLALVYYYGQTSLPMQFFAKLFHLPSNYVMELTDFPHPVSQFVVKDLNENKRDNIRICHYLIAKEILEQLLGKRNTSAERSEKLCLEARNRLGGFCKELIDYSAKKSVKSSTISHILTRTFIFRDNRDMGENAEQTRKKPILSRLIIDIPSKSPLFTERLQILEKLTEAFPNDANFHAHLGRFYACCRPDDEDKVEECFGKALALCEKNTAGKSVVELDDKLLLSLMHIYHMYGSTLQKRIARYTGLSPTDEPEKNSSASELDSRLRMLLRLAKTSCQYFRKCREYSPPGHESCFGYVGEISVRLQICDFVRRRFGIEGYIRDGTDIEASEFVRQSIYTIENLLMDCYDMVEGDDIDKTILRQVFWYNYLFRSQSSNLESMAQGEDVDSYRLRISAKKLKNGTSNDNLALIDNISTVSDIKETIRLYENIFRDIYLSGMTGSKSALDRDYQEWMHAIRHQLVTCQYSVEDVLLQTRRWNDCVHSPMSKFYLFILLSLIGFGKDNMNGKTESLIEADQLKKELNRLSKFVLKPRYPREWLGENGGIKCLLSGTRFIEFMIDERNLKDDRSFRVCKGTICPPNNKKLSGYIDLDLGDNLVPVRVFYIPHTAKLASQAYASSRVEFVLAFSLHHGYEAFNVKRLERFGCVSRRCTGKMEMTSAMDFEICPKCQKIIHREDIQSID